MEKYWGSSNQITIQLHIKLQSSPSWGFVSSRYLTLPSPPLYSPDPVTQMIILMCFKGAGPDSKYEGLFSCNFAPFLHFLLGWDLCQSQFLQKSFSVMDSALSFRFKRTSYSTATNSARMGLINVCTRIRTLPNKNISSGKKGGYISQLSSSATVH
ncbi:hypothetical protein BDV29DRAFT_35935 [Aspergillus leporis]|uniref:Uncharacterized protein n=1 Tax=Aspergillus leporis TaxID=41062 RepID=A0A5N5XAY4_9EURO|nr:hypothetical protein BDV29DRAFT_35935 [Aspergillus leporis]